MNQSTVLTPSDEPVIVISRPVKAPRALVYKLYTDPMHVAQFWGPHGATNPVCEMDVRVGGAWRQVMRFASGNEYGYTSVYLELTPPERIVWRDAPDDAKFGDPLPPASMVTTLVLEETDGITTVTATVRLNSIADRDRQVHMGFAKVVVEGGERLDAYLETIEREPASAS